MRAPGLESGAGPPPRAARETPVRKVRAPRVGAGPNPGPGPGPDRPPETDQAPAALSGSGSSVLRTGPRAADAAPEPARPGRPAPRRRAHSPPPPAPGVLGVLRASGRGCHRRPGGLPRRVPARAPARPAGPPARRECQGARGVRAGGGPAGGGGLTDSGLWNARGPPGPGPSHLLREGD